MGKYDSLLSEFDAEERSLAAPPASVVPQKQGYDRYIPDPKEATDVFSAVSQGGWESMKQGWNQLNTFGGDPLSRIKGVGNIALGLGQEAAAIPAGIGSYIGRPLGRAVLDATGSSLLQSATGGALELAPQMAMPFPGGSTIGAAGKAMGELAPAASMAAKHIPDVGKNIASKVGYEAELMGLKKPKPISVADDTDDVIDNLVEDYIKTRKTSAAKDIDYRTAEDWYKRVLTDYNPESTMPPMSPPVPRDIRLLHKGSPKVGERKYAQDEAGKPVVMSGYADEGGVPTFRTSHSPRMPQQLEAPVGEYENIFQREIAGQPQISQMPLHPGTRPDVLEDMYLPNLESRSTVTPPNVAQEAARIKGVPQTREGSSGQIDPRLLAELELKFGGGFPQGQLDNPPWTPQQTAGVRPPAQMPIAGARPMQEPTPNVLLPSDMMPVAMGTEARQNTNRLRQDLGVPLNPEEVQRQTRAPLAERPPIPEKPITPAQAPKAVTQYGNIEVGQPYDIVMNMGGQEMRSAGGIVKELTYRNEPVVKSGKSVMEPVGYAVLEDGRQVPTKLLQRTGTAQPNIQMTAPATAEMPKPKTSSPPVASSEQTADPAFAKVQAAMGKKTKDPVPQDQPKDITHVIAGIKQAFKHNKGKTTYTQMMDYMPEGTSRAQIDKALKEIKKSKPNLVTATDPKTKEKYAVMGKVGDDQKAAMSAVAKDVNFNRGIEEIRKKIKGTTTYLHNFSASEMDKVGANIKPAVLTKKINDMIAAGKIKVVGENTGKEHTSVTSRMIDSPGDLDEDLLVTFTKGKLSKEEVRTKSHALLKKTVPQKGGWDKTKAVLDLEDEFNRGDITGTEFLDALKRLEKKGKK